MSLRACGSRLRQIGDEVRERMRSLGKDVDALLTEWQAARPMVSPVAGRSG